MNTATRVNCIEQLSDIRKESGVFSAYLAGTPFNDSFEVGTATQEERQLFEMLISEELYYTKARQAAVAKWLQKAKADNYEYLRGMELELEGLDEVYTSVKDNIAKLSKTLEEQREKATAVSERQKELIHQLLKEAVK